MQKLRLTLLGTQHIKNPTFFNEAWSSSERGRNNNDDNNEIFTKLEPVT